MGGGEGLGDFGAGDDEGNRVHENFYFYLFCMLHPHIYKQEKHTLVFQLHSWFLLGSFTSGLCTLTLSLLTKTTDIEAVDMSNQLITC